MIAIGSLIHFIILFFINLIIMSGFRLATLLYYGDLKVLLQSPGDLLHAFVLGLRFDLSALCYLLALALIIYYFIFWHDKVRPYWKSFFTWYWSVGFIAFSIILGLDFGYYSYFQDHINILAFGLFEDDTVALLWTMWKNYPILWLLAATILYCWFIFHLTRTLINKPSDLQLTVRLPGKIALHVLTILIISLGARGGWALFPLSHGDTAITTNPFINHLSYNGFHALIRAVKLKNQQRFAWDQNIQYYGYGNNIHNAYSDYFQIPLTEVPDDPLSLLKRKIPQNTWAENTKPHVVVFVMESFGAYWMRYHDPEFNLIGKLEPHLEQDFFTDRFFPAHASTIGSIGALMIAAPHRPDSPFLTESNLMQKSFRTSPARVYSSQGYQTTFVYGGNLGWRDIGKFARYQGFENVSGQPEIESKMGKLSETHDWGVFDADVFHYVDTLLEHAEEPQFIMVLTTTNHPPYELPKSYSVPEQKIPANLKSQLIGDPKIHDARFKVYRYSNDVLGGLLDKWKSSHLAEKLVVSFTGDHSFWIKNFSEAEVLNKWSVPFYLYLPNKQDCKLNQNTYGSHIDLFATLYHVSLSNVDIEYIGENMCESPENSMAFHWSRIALNAEGGVFVNKPETSHYLKWNTDYSLLEPGEKTDALLKMEIKYRSLMAISDDYFQNERNYLQ